MIAIVRTEIYKLWKKKIFIAVLVLCSFSLIYALAIYFKWSFITITGRLDMITFITTMWTLLIILGVPLIFFAYLGASILGGEISEGQILIEINRVCSKNFLIIGKTTALGVVLFITYLFNFVLSAIFYLLFVAHSAHGYSGLHWHSYNLQMIIINLLTILFIMVFICISMLCSVRFGIFRATIFTIVVYVILKFAVNIHFIDKWLPGYYTMVDTADFTSQIVTYQLLCLVGLSVALIWGTSKSFTKKQY